MWRFVSQLLDQITNWWSASSRTSPDEADKASHQAYLEALSFQSQGLLPEAKEACERILEVQPNNAIALNLLGVLAGQNGDLDHAVRWFQRSLQIDPHNAESHNNLGYALQILKQHDKAIESYDKALDIAPGFAAAYFNRGNAHWEVGELDAAQHDYELALAANPDYAEAHCYLGKTLAARGRHEAATESYERAIALNPDYAEAHENLGHALLSLRGFEAAIQHYGRAAVLAPAGYLQRINLGIALYELRRYEEAVISFDEAIRIKPECADGYVGRANALYHLKRYEAAATDFSRAYEINPDVDYLLGMLLFARMQLCDWTDHDKLIVQLEEKLALDRKVSPPFATLALTGSLALQRKSAEIEAAEVRRGIEILPDIPRYPRHQRIRIGYFSSDFRNHPVSYLAAELFERHDRERFEISAYAFGPPLRDEMTERLEAAFDDFIDVRNLPDREVAELARSLEIDIAVDLGGFTKDNRSRIFAMRAAPIQVGYLGYLGTMGGLVDYLLADPVLIPKESCQHYCEKIVYLPSYQANDSTRQIADRRLSRTELGLPQDGFVYCCFNNNYKITPATFDSWMRILKRAGSAVLLLYAGNEMAERNLRSEAASRGVDPDKLIFGRRLPMPAYLARYRVADLFLDTLPYNAGTTASDALWAGLPVLTYAGEAFASRMAASLLTAIGLSELIVTGEQDYENLAVELAADPKKMGTIREKLMANRSTQPLFDEAQHAKHIEAAYVAMYEISQMNLQPKHIFLSVVSQRSHVGVM